MKQLIQLTLPIFPPDAVLHQVDGVDIWLWTEVQDYRDHVGSYRAPSRMAGAWIPSGFSVLHMGAIGEEYEQVLIGKAKEAHDEIWRQHKTSKTQEGRA